jgi:hypothetical protein
MMMIRYYKFKQRSEQHHKYRKGKWTGSTAIDLLRGKSAPPQSDSTYDNKYMLRGRVLEPLAIEAYERKYKVSVAHYGFVTNSKYPHAGYSPDGVDEANTLLESKSFNLEKHDAIVSGKMPIPIETTAQIQFGMLISELKKARLILYNPDSETPLCVIDVLPDLIIQANMWTKLEALKPKQRPSAGRAKQKYIENNTVKIREARHKRYLKSKKVTIPPQLR